MRARLSDCFGTPLGDGPRDSGVAAAVEHSRVPFGPSFDCIIDVGAHHGQFSLLARALYPSAELICVEPLPEALVVCALCTPATSA